MPIPDYQCLMLPLLRRLGDGRERLLRDVVAELADEYFLTPEDRAALLPSGASLTFASRVGWAKTYMKKAGLVVQPRRGYVQITEQGQEVLTSRPERVDVAYLERFQSFVEFREGTQVPLNQPLPSMTASVVSPLPPDEIMENAYQGLMLALADEVLERVRMCSPQYFERLVVQLLLNMGYGGSRQEAGEAVGKTGDGGIDGVISEDRLGLDAIYIQAKRWESSVGEGPIRDFKGALDAKGAHKGVFITTSTFTPPAIQAARTSRSYKIVLIDGQRLAALMIEHRLGVSVAASYELKRIDSDFFNEDQ